jgi:hypothetical protein
MAVIEQCRSCSKRLRIPDDRIGDGKPIHCPACSADIFVAPPQQGVPEAVPQLPAEMAEPEELEGPAQESTAPPGTASDSVADLERAVYLGMRRALADERPIQVVIVPWYYGWTQAWAVVMLVLGLLGTFGLAGSMARLNPDGAAFVLVVGLVTSPVIPALLLIFADIGITLRQIRRQR